ncbi:MAG: sigma 54-interacting transcriptional regulator [Sandaracinaceae bacterium]
MSRPDVTGATAARTARGELPRSLTVVAHDAGGPKTASLRAHGTLVIGRSRQCELTVDHASVSRRHASIEWSAAGITITDLGATHGVVVNDARVSAVAISAGDVIRLGDIAITLHLHGPVRDHVDTEARFRAQLDYEVRRSRVTREPLALLALRGTGADGWLDAVAPTLCDIDALAPYTRDTALLLLPATDRARARDRAARLEALGVRVAIACQPEDGSNAEALIQAAQEGLLGRSTPPPPTSSPLKFRSEAMHAAIALARRVARVELPILIGGETGTGKELVARLLHEASPRADGPFVGINCAALAETLLEATLFGHERGAFTGAERASEGLFEQAEGGTLFLDEVGEMSARAQASLLRVLETGQVRRVGASREVAVDVRVISATHRDLLEEQAQGHFRSDLYYRLAGFVLELPPLRERGEDIALLAEHFASELADRGAHGLPTELSPTALARLRVWPWPGNVRELRNVVHQAALLARGPRIEEDDLPARLRPSGTSASSAAIAEGEDLRARLDRYEREAIEQALRACGGNQTEAAKQLGLPRRTLVDKLRRYRLDGDD